MKKRSIAKLTGPLLVLILITSLGIYGATSSTPKQITVFAGSAIKPALTEIAELFEEETGIEVIMNFGGSGTVLSQMIISKEGDIYLPGSHDYMIRALEKGVVDPNTIEVVAYLVPAIIVQEGNPKNITSLKDLARPGIRVGIAEPASVCVGEYAVEILENAGLFEEVSKNIVVHAESCSKTAALVVIGQVDAVIGWRVFERWNPDRTDVVYMDPRDIQKIAAIPAALSKSSKETDAARQFLEFLKSEEAQEVLKKYGYITTLEEALSYAPYAVPPNLEVVGP